MPMYSFRCSICGTSRVIFRTVDARDCESPDCCGKPLQRSLDAPRIAPSVNFSEYVSPATGRIITSSAVEKDELARTNSFIKEPGVSQQIAAKKAELRRATAEAISENVARTVVERL